MNLEEGDREKVGEIKEEMMSKKRKMSPFGPYGACMSMSPQMLKALELELLAPTPVARN